MKKMLFAMLFIVVAGCACGPKYPPEFKSEVQRNVERNRAYLDLADDQATTRAQDLEMIKANQKAWRALEEVINK